MTRAHPTPVLSLPVVGPGDRRRDRSGEARRRASRRPGPAHHLRAGRRVRPRPRRVAARARPVGQSRPTSRTRRRWPRRPRPRRPMASSMSPWPTRGPRRPGRSSTSPPSTGWARRGERAGCRPHHQARGEAHADPRRLHHHHVVDRQRPTCRVHGHLLGKQSGPRRTHPIRRRRLGRFGIRVNGIRPGWMDTESSAARPRRRTWPSSETAHRSPPTTRWATPPTSPARRLLRSDYSAWITGQLLAVCGGSSLPPPSGGLLPHRQAPVRRGDGARLRDGGHLMRAWQVQAHGEPRTCCARSPLNSLSRAPDSCAYGSPRAGIGLPTCSCAGRSPPSQAFLGRRSVPSVTLSSSSP